MFWVNVGIRTTGFEASVVLLVIVNLYWDSPSLLCLTQYSQHIQRPVVRIANTKNVQKLQNNVPQEPYLFLYASLHSF